MQTHKEIDNRALFLARAIVDRIDADPKKAGLNHAREVCAGWMKKSSSRAVIEWWHILQRPWGAVRATLLQETEEGDRLRQSTPFCGILTPQERWGLLKQERTIRASQTT